MKNNKPLISIVTVVYNGRESIENTILSVINQTYENIEYIIIDGGSKDGTQEIIKKYQDKITLWISESDKGIYDAMNKGASLSKGEWLNFMNAGDTFKNEETLENIFLNDFYQFDIIYGSVICTNKYEKLIINPKPLPSIENHMIFCHQSSFVRTSVFMKFKFNLQFKIAADYNLFYTLYKENFRFKEIQECISVFEADNGISSRNFYTLKKEFLTINKKWNNPLSRCRFYIDIVLLQFSTALKKNLPINMVRKIKKFKRQ